MPTRCRDATLANDRYFYFENVRSADSLFREVARYEGHRCREFDHPNLVSSAGNSGAGSDADQELQRSEDEENEATDSPPDA